MSGGAAIVMTDTRSGPLPNAQANEEFIVMAANCHDELLTACRDALVTIIETCGGRQNCATPDEQVTIAELRDAIEAAEGGGHVG